MQLTYSATMAKSIAGTLYDLSDRRVDSYVAEGTVSILPGMGVIAGTTTTKQVKVPAAAVTAFKGIAMLQAKEQAADGTVSYAAKDTLPVLDKGRIWAPVTEAVADGGQAYLIHSGDTAGKWAASAGLAGAAANNGAGAAGANTGNGTITLDATTPILAGAKVGVYSIKCIAAAADGGTFRVSDPDGYVLGDIVMATGAGAFANDIKFALADGSSDFIVGDGFKVTVAGTATAIAGAKYKTATTGAGLAVVELN